MHLDWVSYPAREVGNLDMAAILGPSALPVQTLPHSTLLTFGKQSLKWPPVSPPLGILIPRIIPWP